MPSTSILYPLAGALLAASTAAQVAASPLYRLDTFAFDASGGGQSSPASAGWNHAADAGGALGSPGFTAHLGLLGAVDPEPTNAPVVFGATPPFGPGAGGTPVTVSGLHFQHLGAGPTVTARVGGTPVVGLSVLSDTQLAFTTPSGALGPALLEVASVYGSDADPDGFVYTPAVVASAVAPIGGAVTVTDYGPPGVLFSLQMSPVATSIPLPPWGTLLIGPAPLIKVVEKQYPAPDGVHVLPLPVPSDPSLAGAVVHFQAAAVLSFTPLVLVLTNRSTTLVL